MRRNSTARTRIAAAALVAAALAVAPGAAEAAGASDDPPATGTASVEFRQGRAAIANENWTDAIRQFERVVAAEPGNADALNWLGYANRKLGRLDASTTWYQRALAVDPNHKGALEYQGELFLTLGDVARAEANLAKLDRLCSLGCAEHRDLQAAIAAHKAGAAPAAKSW